MPLMIRTTLALALLAALGFSATATQAATAAQKCQAGKNKAAGKYAACRHGAEAKLATTGNLLTYSLTMGKCTTKFSTAWLRLEAHAGGACPSNGDELDIGNVVNGCTSNIATAVGGGVLSNCPVDLAQCSGDLATCLADLGTCPTDLTTCNGDLVACQAEPHGQRLKTGQTTCWNAGGTVIPCAGTGQDGELQKGLAVSYTDNGDGTITDNRTGLMWEKLSDDGSIHDKDNTYTWTNAFAVKIAALNGGGGFAGYTDWRLPNVNELQSLANYGAVNPAVHAPFHMGCVGSCTVTTCSCTQSWYYWSATTFQTPSASAWRVVFTGGGVSTDGKAGNYYVRAVRGGS